jgi:hypothetical protein
VGENLEGLATRFRKLLTSSGIALSMSRLALAEEPDFAARETLPGRQNWNPAATGAGRIDGVVKVTGSKLYAGDFRAADLPGWPASDSTMALGEIDPSTTGSGARPRGPSALVHELRSARLRTTTASSAAQAVQTMKGAAQ